jgi:ABC-type cobalamin/Fe3+-siderophores transport system ATPase subunit
MANRIERMTLQYFRGATRRTELVFDKHKPIVMIFGENGSGKSTIVDAIDMVFNREAGSLADRSSTSAREHLPAIGRKPSDVHVEIVCGGQTWTGSQSGSRISAAGPAGGPTAHILRRKQLLRLIEAAPSERYKELQRFIDVERVEKCEGELKKAERSAGERVTEAIRRKQEAEDALGALWAAEGKPGGAGATAFGWAQEKMKADIGAARKLADELEELVSCLDAVIIAEEQRADAEAKLAALDDSVDQLEHSLQRAEAERTAEGARLVAVLEQVQALIEPSNDTSECPVCRQPVAVERLREEIAARIQAAAEISGLGRQRADLLQQQSNAAAIADQCRRQFLTAAHVLAARLRQAEQEELVALRTDWRRYPLLHDYTGGNLAALRQADAFFAHAASAGGQLAELHDGARKDLNQYHAIKQQYQAVREGDARIAEAHFIHQRLKRALEIVMSERIRFTQAILGSITAECNRLYESIHPDEPLGLSEFKLDESKRASLLQEAHFLGYADVPPQAYFSESHLDTLGFCLFVSLAKLFSKGSTILVLDDVFTSVDQSHLGRIMDLIVAESANFDQIIVTTHYPEWREQYRYLAGSAGGVELVELSPWVLTRGVHLAREPGSRD